MTEKYLDYTIEGKVYRIRPVSATVGNWIVNAAMPNKDREDIFNSIQGHLFAKIFMLKEVGETTSEFPIFKRPDTWLVPDLADDFETVQELFNKSMEYNFSPFFQKLKKKLEESGVVF